MKPSETEEEFALALAQELKDDLDAVGVKIKKYYNTLKKRSLAISEEVQNDFDSEIGKLSSISWRLKCLRYKINSTVPVRVITFRGEIENNGENKDLS
jgi:hypothetical protein